MRQLARTNDQRGKGWPELLKLAGQLFDKYLARGADKGLHTTLMLLNHAAHSLNLAVISPKRGPLVETYNPIAQESLKGLTQLKLAFSMLNISG